MAARSRSSTARARTSAGRKSKGLALHLGLNLVSPKHYEGWSGALAACEFDARDMAAIAKTHGMKSKVLLTRKATRTATLKGLRAAAKQLKSGDLFLLTYSGHGGQVPDVSGEEADKKDETWCLFDGQLIDDELYFELSRFRAGVRILVFSDSCHSGTVTRAPVPQPGEPPPARSRMMPPGVAMRTYREHQAFYDDLQLKIAKQAARAPEIDPDAALSQVAVSNRLIAIAGAFKPAVILISGCQDNQTSLDGEANGAFTEQLLAVWNNGAFQGNYARFHALIRSRLPASQSPNLFTLGRTGNFIRQRPFRV